MAFARWIRALPKPAVPARSVGDVLWATNRNAKGYARLPASGASAPSRIGTVSVIGRVGVVSELPVTASTRYFARSEANRIEVKVECPVPPAQAGTVSIVGRPSPGNSAPAKPAPSLEIGTADKPDDSLSRMMMASEYVLCLRSDPSPLPSAV